MESKSIKTTDKTDSISFHIDGITEGETLFTVIGGPEAPVINAGMPGTEGIQGGFEGGSIVKINGVYHMFPTERAGVKGMPAYHDRVKTRIGHWTSTDAVHWTRQSTILESSGVYALVHEDNPGKDRLFLLDLPFRIHISRCGRKNDWVQFLYLWCKPDRIRTIGCFLR